MANQIGTATGLEDLFTKIVSFLSTDTTLVAANQNWQVLRLRRDNIATLTTNLREPSTVGYRTTIQTCRYDCRSLNVDNEAAYRSGYFYSTATLGTSYVQWQLRVAKEVKSVKIKSPLHSSDLTYGLRNFRLQYSDDGSNWTTALTVSSSPVYSLGEVKEFAVSGTPGAHLYWKIIVDSSQGGSAATAWSYLLLLTADGEVANQFGSEVIFKAPGNAGSDEIFTGIRSEYNAAAGWYNLFMNGYTGYDANVQSWFNQPGALPGYGMAGYQYVVPMVPCWGTSIPYWFVATGRSFRFAVKISSSYEGGYLGYILPYATPSQYPYPLAVGGSLVPRTDLRGAEWRYSYTSIRHGVYPAPGCDSYATAEGRQATLYIRNPDGEWAYFGNRGDLPATDESKIYAPSVGGTSPYTPGGNWRGVWPHCMNDANAWTVGKRPYRECLGGGYIVQPCIPLQRSPYPCVYGELEGTYVISGYQNTAENTTTVSGKNMVIFQNAYRNSAHEFWALSMD